MNDPYAIVETFFTWLCISGSRFPASPIPLRIKRKQKNEKGFCEGGNGVIVDTRPPLTIAHWM